MHGESCPNRLSLGRWQLPFIRPAARFVAAGLLFVMARAYTAPA
jgi:hypothetical protein